MDDVLLPLPRTEECRHCGVDLHVCRMCRFYDTGVSNACREPIADFVSDKTRANFCGYLELIPNPAPGSGRLGKNGAEDGLGSLFGLDQQSKGASDVPGSLDDLFGLKDENDN